MTSVLVPSETLSTKVTVTSESTAGAVKVVNCEVAFRYGNGQDRVVAPQVCELVALKV